MEWKDLALTFDLSWERCLINHCKIKTELQKPYSSKNPRFKCTKVINVMKYYINLTLLQMPIPIKYVSIDLGARNIFAAIKFEKIRFVVHEKNLIGRNKCNIAIYPFRFGKKSGKVYGMKRLSARFDFCSTHANNSLSTGCCEKRRHKAIFRLYRTKHRLSHLQSYYDQIDYGTNMKAIIIGGKIVGDFHFRR